VLSASCRQKPPPKEVIEHSPPPKVIKRVIQYDHHPDRVVIEHKPPPQNPVLRTASIRAVASSPSQSDSDVSNYWTPPPKKAIEHKSRPTKAVERKPLQKEVVEHSPPPNSSKRSSRTTLIQTGCPA
jgi:hypothetical protein